jgi:hypothetical protein
VEIFLSLTPSSFSIISNHIHRESRSIMSLTMDQAAIFVDSFLERRKRFPGEPEEMALMVLLFNFGDHLTKVVCTNGEFIGVKGDLPILSGVPVCPSGHPLYEDSEQCRLELVPQVRPELKK